MPAHPSQPTDSQPTDEPWRDANGTPIPLRCWVEQIAVDKAHGALPRQLHQRGQVIGRGAGMVYVIFDHNYLIALPTHLVRVLTAPGGC
jgi:hypothetical protein